MNSLAPIVLFTYNRRWHTEQTINAIKKNELSSKSILYIYSDAAKNEKALESVQEVRDYINTIKGFKAVTIIERKSNFGLAKSIVDGVTKIVEKHGKVIVLEDDLVTSPYFLTYMNEALDKYVDDERVISIHGYVFPVEQKLPEAFFLKGADCWGWATWKRGWNLFNPDGKYLLNELTQRKLIREFNFNGSYAYSSMLKQQIQRLNDSWAILWYASAFLENKLTLYPGRSLVQNIGNDSSGTHCGTSNIFNANLTKNKIDLKNIEIKNSEAALRAFEKFLKSIKESFLMRVLKKIKK